MRPRSDSILDEEQGCHGWKMGIDPTGDATVYAPYMWDMGPPRIFRWRFFTTSFTGNAQPAGKAGGAANRGASNHPSLLVILFGRKPWVKRATPIFGNPQIFGHFNQEECGSVWWSMGLCPRPKCGMSGMNQWVSRINYNCCCCCCCCGGCCWTSKNSSLNQKTVWCFEVQDFDRTIAGSRDGKPVVYGDVDMM